MTLSQIEKLLDNKLVRLENNLVGHLKVQPPINKKKVNPEVKLSSQPSTSRKTETQKTFNIECLELVNQVNCSNLINI